MSGAGRVIWCLSNKFAEFPKKVFEKKLDAERDFI